MVSFRLCGRAIWSSGTHDVPCIDATGMVVVEDFLIDTHEVTNAEYAELLNDMVGGRVTVDQDPNNCAFKMNPSTSPVCTAINGPDRPVGCVDWCDADRFCRGRGKRLCGARGDGSTVSQAADASQSECMRACVGDPAHTSLRKPSIGFRCRAR